MSEAVEGLKQEPEKTPEPDTAELDSLAADLGGGEYIPNENGEPKAPPEPEVKTGDVVAGLLKVSFDLIAARAGDHWALADEEAKAAGEAYGEVIDKYFPEVEMGPEVTAVTVTAAIFLPKYMMHKAVEAEKAKKDGGADGSQSR